MSRWCNAYTSLIWCHLYFLWSKSHSNWKPLSVQLLNCSVLFLLTTVTSAQNQHYADLLMCYVCKFLIFFLSPHFYWIYMIFPFQVSHYVRLIFMVLYNSIHHFISLSLHLFAPRIGRCELQKKIKELLKNVIASLSGKNKPQVSTHTIAMEFVRQSKVWLLIDDKMPFILELKAISIYFPSGFLVVLFRFFYVSKMRNLK